MALFGRGGKETAGAGRARDVLPLPKRDIWCAVCGETRSFTRVWRRKDMLRQCPCCGMAFDTPRALYQRFQPQCPQCGEFLEQPDFDYGHCDACGSKFEIVQGTKPGLLPNAAQRKEMEKHGKTWSPS